MRIDSELWCAGIDYDARRLKACHAHVRATPLAARLFTGAVVSPAHLAVSKGENPSCPYCGQQAGDLRHCAWLCADPRLAAGRPCAEPSDPLQARLFWPKGERNTKALDDAIVSWGLMLDEIILSDRYN